MASAVRPSWPGAISAEFIRAELSQSQRGAGSGPRLPPGQTAPWPLSGRHCRALAPRRPDSNRSEHLDGRPIRKAEPSAPWSIAAQPLRQLLRGCGEIAPNCFRRLLHIPSETRFQSLRLADPSAHEQKREGLGLYCAGNRGHRGPGFKFQSSADDLPEITLLAERDCSTRRWWCDQRRTPWRLTAAIAAELGQESAAGRCRELCGGDHHGRQKLQNSRTLASEPD